MSEFDVLHVRALDDLPSIALGEPADTDLAVHIDSCVRCRDDLETYRRIAGVGRATGALPPLAEPPPAVWSRIAAQIADEPPTAVPTAVPAAIPAPAPTAVPTGGARRAASRPDRQATRRPPLLGVAAAVVAVLAAAGIGWAAGRSSSPSISAQTQAAALQAQPGTAVSAHGTATMHATSGGFVMDVQTSGLPARDGFYEVWLYDPSAAKMVPIGLLGTGGRGSFTVPGALDVAAYHVVDVSIQRYDGDPRHGTSALRGTLNR